MWQLTLPPPSPIQPSHRRWAQSGPQNQCAERSHCWLLAAAVAHFTNPSLAEAVFLDCHDLNTSLVGERETRCKGHQGTPGHRVPQDQGGFISSESICQFFPSVLSLYIIIYLLHYYDRNRREHKLFSHCSICSWALSHEVWWLKWKSLALVNTCPGAQRTECQDQFIPWSRSNLSPS